MMIKTTTTCRRAAAVLLLLAPAAACALPGDRATSTSSKPAKSSANTLQAFVIRHEKTILAADTDGDGKVSKSEFMAAAKVSKGDPAKRFTRIDTKGDGMLDKAEIDAMLARKFRTLDANGDGVVGADERAAAHGKKGKAASGGSDT